MILRIDDVIAASKAKTPPGGGGTGGMPGGYGGGGDYDWDIFLDIYIHYLNKVHVQYLK